MRFGGDYLGGKHYEKAMLRAHPAGGVGGIFLRTFGDARATVEKMAASGKFSEIVVHLAPFDRTHRYEISKYGKQVKKDAAWLETVSVRYPRVVFLLSPFCESNHKRSVLDPFFKELKAIAPSCLMLNSVWKGEEIPGIITEIHLENRKPKKKPKGEYTVAFDGFGGDGSGDYTDTDVPSILQYYADARHIRCWNFRFNGKYGHKDTAPVDKRKHWPDEHYLRGHLHMMGAREGAVTWPSSALYKPFADDHGSGGKDNKAMCILPKVSKNSVTVFDSNGNKIDVMVRLKPDHANDPKGPRYYSKLYAYQIADIAQRNTGSRQIRIENLPLTDGDLRSGRFK